jgi:hypothetical protein
MPGSFAHITLVNPICQDADNWTLGVDHKWYLLRPPVPAEFTMDPAQKDKP